MYGNNDHLLLFYIDLNIVVSHSSRLLGYYAEHASQTENTNIKQLKISYTDQNFFYYEAIQHTASSPMIFTLLSILSRLA